MTKVFLCVRDLVMLQQLLTLEQDLKIVGISTTMLDQVEELSAVQADVLVLQYAIDVERSKRLLQQISMDETLQKMNVIPLFQELDSNAVHLLIQYDIHNFLVEPYDVTQLMEAINAEHQKREFIQGMQQNEETRASLIMVELGLPVHLKGFRYILTSAIQVSNVLTGSHYTMRDVFNETARIHNTTAVRVEKCIRTAINFAYRNSPEKVCIYNAKPTCSQIVCYIGEYVKLETIT